MNKVMLTGRITHEPELRVLAGGRAVFTFTITTHQYEGGGREKSEYINVVAWDRLAEVCGQYLVAKQLVAIDGRLQTRRWSDDRGVMHWKTEVVAASIEMLSGRQADIATLSSVKAD